MRSGSTCDTHMVHEQKNTSRSKKKKKNNKTGQSWISHTAKKKSDVAEKKEQQDRTLDLMSIPWLNKSSTYIIFRRKFTELIKIRKIAYS